MTHICILKLFGDVTPFMATKMKLDDKISFNTEHLNVGIKKRSLRGGATTISAQGLSFAIQMASTVVLARILTPEDYGIIAMVATVTGFASILASLGLSTATIQSAAINHDQVSVLFWVNVCIGMVTTFLVASMAPLIVWFYKTPSLFWVVVALSFDFLISGLGVQHRAILNRQMRFYALAKIEISAMITGIVVAVFLAYHGFGYWSLVFNRLCCATTSTFGAWIGVRWLPSFPRRNTGARALLKFGADIVGFNTINYFSRNADNILIGRYFGGTELGIYNKAYQLLMMPIINLRDPLTRVALPALSRLQNEPEMYRNYYKKYISILAFISMPLIVYLFICSDQIISLILGDQWLKASPIFKVLSIAAFIQPVSTTWGLVLLSTGKSKRYFYWGVVNAVFTISGFAMGLPWGAKGIAIAFTIVNYALLYPSLRYSFKNTPLKVNDFLISIYKPLISGLVMGGSCFVLLLYIQHYTDLIVLSSCLIFSLLVYLLVLVSFFNGRSELYEYYQYGRLIFSKK